MNENEIFGEKETMINQNIDELVSKCVEKTLEPIVNRLNNCELSVERLQQDVSTVKSDTKDLKERFLSLETTVQNIETNITSKMNEGFKEFRKYNAEHIEQNNSNIVRLLMGAMKNPENK